MPTQLELGVKDSEASLLPALLMLASQMLLLLAKVDEKPLPWGKAFSAKLTGKSFVRWFGKLLLVFCLWSLGRESPLHNRKSWIPHQHSCHYFSLFHPQGPCSTFCCSFYFLLHLAGCMGRCLIFLFCYDLSVSSLPDCLWIFPRESNGRCKGKARDDVIWCTLSWGLCAPWLSGLRLPCQDPT